MTSAAEEKPTLADLMVALGQMQSEIGCRLYQQALDAGCHEGSNGLAGDDVSTSSPGPRPFHTSWELENRIEALAEDVKRQALQAA